MSEPIEMTRFRSSRHITVSFRDTSGKPRHWRATFREWRQFARDLAEMMDGDLIALTRKSCGCFKRHSGPTPSPSQGGGET